ncbi:MAG TPA: 30S ribosomal protein S17 [Elusimicrobia bacterium]|jgi:small subunit ribosomal protein S17|nr:MAG: 30S ribosomal protein S17 [Elusimicrobia bacterium GWA2_64_40]OGR68106.1 MAG: 30S ribosomal protein S17 [Elusimicrobia bacterium GWB2_63_16]HAN05906.1 30S ribosomal protein S17 [Elusimicrobiota bacterium]HAU89378.1 30S ribosomal protein S17 [Elusimicrobiota bacterium]
MTENTEKTESRGNRKVMRGVVVSDKMTKTRVISVDHVISHKVYSKTLRRNRKFYAHDEANESKAGDLVEIVNTRPLSALKRWRISRIVEKAAK